MIVRDDRGVIVDLFVGRKWAVTYITFEPGAIRGGHFHKATVQLDLVLTGKLFCVQGLVNKIGRLRNKKRYFRTVRAGSKVCHNRQVYHQYFALKRTRMLSITRGPRKGRDYATDTFKLAHV